MVAENFPPGVPEEFQKAGITALLYDPRNTGRSGGFPRNSIDPFKQAEDYSDAFIYLSAHPMVNPAAIVFWGISLSAGIALSNAAVDRRIAAVIAIAPIFKFVPVKATDAERLKSKLMKDRESQLLQNTPPYILPLMESLAEIPFNSHVNASKDNSEEVEEQKQREEHARLAEAWALDADDDDEYDPLITHNNYGTTIQSYHRMFMFEPVPAAMVKQINPTPVFFFTPEMDQISPPDQQTQVFESLEGPKRQLFAPGKEHIYVLHGPEMPGFVKWQTDFIWQVVRGRFKHSLSSTASEKQVAQGVVEAVIA